MALTNNDIIKKLRVALHLRDVDIIEILALVDYKIGKSELGAFFRKETHEKYMPMQDQILRNFLNGLVIYKRGELAPKKKPQSASDKKPEDWIEKKDRSEDRAQIKETVKPEEDQKLTQKVNLKPSEPEPSNKPKVPYKPKKPLFDNKPLSKTVPSKSKDEPE